MGILLTVHVNELKMRHISFLRRLNMCIVIAVTPQQSLGSGPNVGMEQKMDHV